MIHGFQGAPRWMVWPEWRNSTKGVNRSIISFISGTDSRHIAETELIIVFSCSFASRFSSVCEAHVATNTFAFILSNR